MTLASISAGVAGTETHIAAVVVTFNRFDYIQATVVRLEDEGVDTLVVVDNGSTDGTREWLVGRESDRFHPVFTDANFGGAGGFAIGMQYVRKNVDADWVLLTDDDGWPEPNALAVFRAMDFSGCDGIAAAVRYPDGRVCDMNRPGRNPFQLRRRWNGSFRITDTDYDPSGSPLDIDMATFVGLFLSRRALEAVEGPDPRLFIYGDDLIHTLQLSQAGMRLVFAPQIRFKHDCTTMAGEAKAYRPLWKVYYHYRNAILLYRQAAGWLSWPILALRLPKWWFAARHYGPDAREFRRLLRQAVADGVIGRLPDPPGRV